MIVDLSVFNGKINYRQMVERGVDGAILRASIGGVVDGAFQTNWSALSELGVDLSAYLVVHPNADLKTHQTAFQRAVGDRKFSDRFLGVPVLDVEITPSNKSAYARLIKDLSNWLTDKYGRRPIIYTRQTFWDFTIPADPVWREHPLWVALYVPYKASGKEFIPIGNVWGAGNRFKFRDWDTWFLWQFSADTNNLGAYYGVSSDSIDLNIMNTDYVYTPKSSGDVITTTSLNLRSGPSTSAPVIATLPQGTRLSVEQDDGTWLKVTAYVYKSYTRRA